MNSASDLNVIVLLTSPVVNQQYLTMLLVYSLKFSTSILAFVTWDKESVIVHEKTLYSSSK